MISDLLDHLKKCEYFKTLDFADGFHQMDIYPSKIRKTVYNVKNGLSECLLN